MSDKATKTRGGALLRRGDTFDIEDWRTTHRLRVGHSILRGLGIEPSFPKHDPKCILSAEQAFRRGGQDRYRFNCECGVGHDPNAEWPEWVTGSTFDLAYQLANEVQTERGAWNQREASRARRERQLAERSSTQS